MTKTIANKINVLNDGYVVLQDVMGNDLTVVNAARCSYDRKSEEMTEKDEGLIRFLAREGHCYDKETEVLTLEGFKRWDEIDETDKLGSVDPSSMEFIGFEKPSNFYKYNVSDTLLHYKTRDVDLKVTSGHTLYCSITDTVDKRSNPVFELRDADEELSYGGVVSDKAMRMSRVSFNKKTGNSEGNSIYKLYGFFIGDGHSGTANRLSFHLKKQRKINYLRSLCKELGYELRELKHNNYSIVEHKIGETFQNMFYNEDKHKTIPTEFFDITLNQYKSLKDGLLNSDGHLKRGVSFVYDTNSRELADRLQALGSINGDALSFSFYPSGLIRITSSTKKCQPRINDNKNNKVEKVKYEGEVYCATVSTGLLIVRRNSKVVLSGNSSPFRHTFLQFEIKAPLMVTRQHFKYLTGSSFQEATGDNMTAWNEESRRYVRDEPSFYIPGADEWRSAPANSKQGSGDAVDFEYGCALTGDLQRVVDLGIEAYENAIKGGVAPEQARLFLPAYGMYVRYYWSASLQSVAHFVKQRQASDSQFEIQEYAHAIRKLAEKEFPVSMRELLKERS